MNVDKLISRRHLHYILDSKSKISAVQISIEEWNEIVQKLKKYEVELGIKTGLAQAISEAQLMSKSKKAKQTLSAFLDTL
jgi:hypothetical protein